MRHSARDGHEPGLSVNGSPSAPPRPATTRFVLRLAEGFGLGRSPILPGTCGTLLGLPWTAALLATGSVRLFALGTLAGLAVSVWAAGVAERERGRHDPPSGVIDEFTALPLAFLPLVLDDALRQGIAPGAGAFLGRQGWWMPLLVFGLFRVFDIWKPWPAGASQRLPGGWGVTADDGIAALYAGGAAWVLGPLG